MSSGRLIAFLLACAVGLTSLPVFAQGASPGTPSRGAFLKKKDYATPGDGAVSYFVNASTGDDSNGCTSALTPCLTIQGALNYVPKLLRDLVTVNVADGNYGCFRISGFTYDTGVQNNNGGLYFTGNLLTATGLATGTATGTSSAGSVGSGTTFGTLTDGTQTWTVNDLRGRLITIGASKFVISSNTGTVITTVGSCSTCAGAVAYTIQKPGWNINTACGTTPTPLSASTANSCQICANDNNITYRQAVAPVVIENVGFTAAAGAGLLVNDGAGYRVTQFMKTTGTGNLATVIQNSTPFISLAVGSNTGGTGSYALSLAGGTGLVQNVLAYGSNAGLATLIGNTVAADPIAFFLNSESTNSTSSGVTVTVGRASVQSVRLDCASSGGFGLTVGQVTAALISTQAPMASVASQTIVLGPTCGTGVLVAGLGWMSIADSTITGATNGVMSNWGGFFAVVGGGGGVAITGGTNGFSLDNGNVVGLQADVSTGSCAHTVYGSRFCN